MIGAGLAGLSAAYVLAKKGRTVLVIEKGTYPGSKSVSGGRLYLNPVRKLMPEILESDDAPFERFVSREALTLMKEDSAVSLELASGGFDGKPYHSCTILRSKFDQWLASRAEEKGAMIVPDMKVDEISRKKGELSVKVGEDDVQAGVAIIAEGSNSILTRKLGLCGEMEPRNFAVGVKEVIELPEQTINDRFGVESKEGAANLFVGAATKGLKGGGFLYTNQQSISLGIVVGVDAAMLSKVEVHRMFDDFKAHRAVRNFVKGGKTVEYSAHTIPEGGFNAISKLYDNNILVAGDAAGFAMNMGFTVRGMDFAIASGYHAGQAADGAIKKNRFSREALSSYETALRGTFVLKDLENYRNMGKFLDNPRLYRDMPPHICDVFENLMRFGTGSKESVKDFLLDEARKELKKHGYMNVLVDTWRALRWL